MEDLISLLFTYGTCAIVLLLFIYRMVQLYIVRTKKDGKGYQRILAKYQNTVGKVFPGKTLKPASDFFEIENWYAVYNIKYSHLRAAASTLVGLGIFGTFLGLAISLNQIDLSGREEEITQSIQNIMGGINTAFYSSVCGMFFSIIFALCRRQQENRINTKLAEWSNELDEQYYTDQLILIAEQTVAIKSFGQAIGTSVGSQVASQLESSMTELIETVTDCIKEQMQAAGQYMADSASQLKASTDTLLATTDSIKEASAGMQSLLKNVDKSMTEVSSMVDKIESAQEEFGNAASELGDSAVQLNSTIAIAKTTILALDSKFSAFGDAMIKVENALQAMQAAYASLNGHNSKLEEQYKLVSALIGKLAGDMDKQQSDFLKSLAALKQTIGEVPNLKPDIQAIFDRINEGLKSYVELLQNQTSGLLSTYTQEFTKACQSIQSTTGQLNSVMEEGATNLTMAVKQSAQVMSEAASKVIKESKA